MSDKRSLCKDNNKSKNKNNKNHNKMGLKTNLKIY